MATQGLLTILDENCEVAYKVITGAGGQELDKFIEMIKDEAPQGRFHKDFNEQYLYNAALKAGFGGEISLVSMSNTRIYHSCDGELHPRYRQTFPIPEFNPRWACGEVEYYGLLKRNSFTGEIS